MSNFEMNLTSAIEGKVENWNVKGFQKLVKEEEETPQQFEERCKNSDAFVELVLKTEIHGVSGIVQRLANVSPVFHGITEAINENNAFSRKVVLETYPDSDEYALKLSRPTNDLHPQGELLFHWFAASFKKIRVSLTKSGEQTVEFTFVVRLQQSLDELRKIDGVNVMYEFMYSPSQQSLNFGQEND